MAIEITVGEEAVKAAGIDLNAPPDIIVNIKGPIFTVKLDARKTLDGNIIVYDHKFFNIVFVPFKNKIITMPKQHVNRDTYNMQNDYLTFLQERGAIQNGTIKSGGVFRSLEAFYPVNKDLDVLQVLLLLTKEYMKKHGGDFAKMEDYFEDVEEMYVDPPDDETTPYGKVPQEAEKGTLPSPYGKPYGLVYRI
tara:strand:- start:92 stop:670 length:579 start_codon:yes stop_codon:yes gene_type:complete